jgi:hypothetical protein
MQKYRYSILAFNNIYNGLPGDLERATFHWPEKTEDGDGNRLIGSLAKEEILAWQHLQLSNQISFESEMTGNWHQDVEGKLEPSYNEI